jgi:hypothetical protein
MHARTLAAICWLAAALHACSNAKPAYPISSDAGAGTAGSSDAGTEDGGGMPNAGAAGTGGANPAGSGS